MPISIKFAATRSEAMQCFAVLSELRPHIPKDDFVATIKRLSKDTGFRLAYLLDGEVKAVAGIRVA